MAHRIIVIRKVCVKLIMSNQYRYDDDNADARLRFSELLDLYANSAITCLSV